MTPETDAPLDAGVQAQPLSGVVVIDLGQQFAAPYATMLLALAGAEVIKVEPPGGEALRRRAEIAGTGAGIPFHLLNVNKASVTLNLKDRRGRELLDRLLRRADVLVENFRPGVMDRLDFGPRAVRERHAGLIYASCSGYGRSSAYSDVAAMDLSIQAMSGVVATTGFPDGEPVKAGPAIADFLGGVHLYGAIITALYRRTTTDRGAHLDIAMLDAVYPTLLSNVGAMLGAEEPPPERTGNQHGGFSVCPYNVYPTADGHVAIMCIDERHWRSLTEVMGSPELGRDPRYATKQARVRSRSEVDSLVGAWARDGHTAEAFAALRRAGVPSAPVRHLAEVVKDESLRERGMIHDADVPGVGNLPLMHSPLRFSGEQRVPLRHARALGADNDAVLGEWLGCGVEELCVLHRDGVI